MSQVSGLFCFISISIYNCNNYQHVLTLLQIQKIYLFGTNGKTDFYDLWQQHKQLKTMEMSDAWLYVFYELYIHQLQQILLTKFTTSSRSTKFKDILLLNNSHIITKTNRISMRIVKSYAMKWGIPLRIGWKVHGNSGNMIRICQQRKSHCRTNTSKVKTRKVNHLSEVI